MEEGGEGLVEEGGEGCQEGDVFGGVGRFLWKWWSE